MSKDQKEMPAPVVIPAEDVSMMIDVIKGTSPENTGERKDSWKEKELRT